MIRSESLPVTVALKKSKLGARDMDKIKAILVFLIVLSVVAILRVVFFRHRKVHQSSNVIQP